MDTVLIVAASWFALASVLLGIFHILDRKTRGSRDVADTNPPDWLPRMEQLELRQEHLLKEVQLHLQKADASYARARATQSAIERKRLAAQDEGEPDQSDQLSLGDGEGGDVEGMPAVHPDVGDPHEDVPPWIAVGREISRRIIEG